MTAPEQVADAAWRWVLDQVRWDDELWIPKFPSAPLDPKYRDSVTIGVGGLACALAEIRLSRPLTAEEQRLAEAIAEQVRGSIATATDASFFNGLAGMIGALTALEAPGAEAAVDRLLALATPGGWPQSSFVPPRYLPGAPVHDLVLGTAGVLLSAVWAARAGVPGARALADLAVDVLLAETEHLPTGSNWRHVPQRFRSGAPLEMPNFSHGLAGIAAALAVCGAEFGRCELVEAAAGGAEHLVHLGRTDSAGFVVPALIPRGELEEFSYGWCHGPAGTSLFFLALHHAGVAEVAGASPLVWERRCLHSTRTSGLPARLRPGFWDNDGRCCGTAGVGEVFLDSWQRGGSEDDLAFALRLADTLVERAIVDGDHAYWRFIEHRKPEPLLPPGVGWFNGAAGIAAFLFRAGRVLRDGERASQVPRMDTWWALPK